MPNTQKKYGFLALLLMLNGCSSLSGDWPNLAEPYPDTTERDRVIERANPVEPSVVKDESPLTRSTAFKLLESTRASLLRERGNYASIKANIADSEGDDRIDYWNEAQLALTRISQTASDLDAILDADMLKDAPVWAEARQLKEEEDRFLVSERKLLKTLKP